jgi:recombination protein RecA
MPPKKKAVIAPKVSPQATALQKFTVEFEKAFPKTLTLKPQRKYEFISTGSLDLDAQMGGGFVRGRLAELWGIEQTGKSTLLMCSCAEAQRLEPDKMIAWVDVEKTFDPNWANAHGVDTERMFLAQPDDAEQVADIIKKLISSDLCSFIVLDSIGAMIPKVEKEKDADEATMAIAAKVITRMVKIAAADLPKSNAVLAVINQARANLAYGGDLARTGGFALSHVTTHRLYHRRAEKPFLAGSKADGTEVIYGQRLAIKVEKNKIAPPGRTAYVTMFNQETEHGPIGIDAAQDALMMGVRLGVIRRSGAWHYLPDETKHGSKEETLAYLRQNRPAIELIREGMLTVVSKEHVDEPLSRIEAPAEIVEEEG